MCAAWTKHGPVLDSQCFGWSCFARQLEGLAKVYSLMLSTYRMQAQPCCSSGGHQAPRPRRQHLPRERRAVNCAPLVCVEGSQCRSAVQSHLWCLHAENGVHLVHDRQCPHRVIATQCFQRHPSLELRREQVPPFPRFPCLLHGLDYTSSDY